MAIKNIQDLTQVSSISNVDQVQDGIVFYDQSATGDEKTKTLTLPALIDLIETIPAAAWIRPADWLALPTASTGEQKFSGLLAIFDSGTEYNNVCEISCAGSYTVNWGDGVTENFSSGATATHTYTYSSISSSTLSSRGYRQAVVTVTPQSGQNLTSVNLHLNSTGSNLLSQWLEVSCNSPNLTSFSIGSNANTIRFPLLENVILKQNNVSNFSHSFRGLTVLKSFDLNTASGTNFSSMLQGNIGIEEIPYFDTSNATSLGSIFNGCFSARKFPNLITPNVTNFSSAFQNCTTATEFPTLNTANATNIVSMFQGCTSAIRLPPLSTGSSTSFSSFANSCTNLQSFPLINTSGSANMSNFFTNCSSLQTIPALDFSNATNLSTVFSSASNISSILATGFKVSFSVASLKLGQAALVTLFNNLATVTGQTITITGNPGASLLTAGERAIATGKGWTITG